MSPRLPPRLRAVTVAELSIALAIGAFLAAAAITIGNALLADRSRDSAYLALRSIASAVQGFGRRAGRLSALGDDPAVGIDHVLDAGLLARRLVAGTPGPGETSPVVLPTSHRVLARAGDASAARRHAPLGLLSARGAVLSVGGRLRPVRDPGFCSGLLTLDFPALRGVMLRTADWAAPTDALVVSPTAAPTVSFPDTGVHARAWAAPFRHSGLAPVKYVQPLADLTPAVATTQCAQAVAHPSGVMVVYAIGPSVP